MSWTQIPDYDSRSWNGRAVCAVCQACKRRQNERIFRTNVFDDWAGHFDICENCIKEAAHELGMVDGDLLEEVDGSLAAAEKEIAELRELVNDQDAVLAAIADFQARFAAEDEDDE